MKAVLDDGTVIALGTTETGPTIGIRDFSRRTTDDFGVTTVVERGFARTLSARTGLPLSDVDAVQRRLAGLRATAVTWVADDRFAALSVNGFFKEFELTLATELSQCTLTVEGLAETDTAALIPGDPAVQGGRSSLMMLDPVAMTDALLISSSVVEDDAPAWGGAERYALGARVIAGHRVYESSVDGNVGEDPAVGLGRWIDVGPTNRWAMFDQALGTKTETENSIELRIDGGAADAIALLDVGGDTVRVRAAGYDRVQTVGPGAMLFLDLPGVSGLLTITIVSSGLASVGTLLVGNLRGLGVTATAPTAGITDFSRKDVDDFGAVTIVERAWAKKMAARAMIRTDMATTVFDRLAAVRARPVLWIGDSTLDAITVYGFFREFSINVEERTSMLSLSIEGLSKAAKPVPISSGVSDWADLTDETGTKPANNATNSADPNSPFSTSTVGVVLENVGRSAREAAASKALAESIQNVTIPAVNAAVAQADGRITAARGVADAARSRSDQALTTIASEVQRLDERISSVSADGGYDDTAVYSEVRRVETAAIGRDSALSTRVDSVSSAVTTNDGSVRALIQTKEDAAVGRENAISQRVDEIIASGGGGSTVDSVARSEISRVERAAASRDDALGSRIDTVSAAIGSAVNAKAEEITTAFAAADLALANRTSLLETFKANVAADLPALTARVGAAETALTDGRFATAQRVTNVEATAGDALGRAKTAETAVSDGRFAAASRVQTLESSYGDTKATVAAQGGTIAGLNSKTTAYFQVVAAAGGNRVQVTIAADSHAGAGIDIVGNVRINGSLIITGSITRAQVGVGEITTMQVVRSGTYFDGQSSPQVVLDYGLNLPEGAPFIIISNGVAQSYGEQTYGRLSLFVDGNEWGSTVTYTAYGNGTSLSFSHSIPYLSAGGHQIQLRYEGAGTAIYYPSLGIFGAFR